MKSSLGKKLLALCLQVALDSLQVAASEIRIPDPGCCHELSIYSLWKRRAVAQGNANCGLSSAKSDRAGGWSVHRIGAVRRSRAGFSRLPTAFAFAPSLSGISSAEEALPPLLAISGSLCTCPSLHLATLPDWTFPEGRGHISPAQRPLRATSLFLISCFHNGVAHNFDLSENLLPAGSPGLAGRRGVSIEQRHQTASSSKNLQRNHHNIL